MEGMGMYKGAIDEVIGEIIDPETGKAKNVYDFPNDLERRMLRNGRCPNCKGTNVVFRRYLLCVTCIPCQKNYAL